MATRLRSSADINTFNACAGRYVLTGYDQRHSTEEAIGLATQVDRLSGVEVLDVNGGFLMD